MQNQNITAIAARLILTGTTIFLFWGCHSKAPETPAMASVEWKTFSNPKLQYSLEYPDACEIVQYGDRSVFFKYNGGTIFRVEHVTEEECRDNGLWLTSKPIGEIQLGGRKGHRYIYNHYDGPIYSHTISYVTEHQGKFLGIEFRTDNDELDEVHRHILNSFSFKL